MRFLKANRLFSGEKFLAEDSVLVLDEKDQLVEIISENALDSNRIERLEGLLTPGFVNAHCHLELSHLKGQIPEHTGLPGFAKQIVSIRNAMPAEERAEHAREADKNMWNKGMVLVGDISNTEESFKIKADSKLSYHTFIELIGLHPASVGAAYERGLQLIQTLKNYNLKGSLAPHAPYSTSNELIQRISDYDASHHLPFSIHNQESLEETKFFAGEKNGFNELYDFLKLDLSWFKAPKQTSLKNYLPFLPESPSLLVHNTFSQSEEIKMAGDKGVFWCFCPAANQYIENALPDYSLFSNYKNQICLGTDSLASNVTLDVLAELNLIRQATNCFELADLLRAITSNGARALALSDHFGKLIPGKNTGLNLLEEKNSTLRFIKKIS